MKKREIVSLIDLNMKVLRGTFFKKLVIPKFGDINEELDILREEKEEAEIASKEAIDEIKKYTCDHSVRFHYPTGWGYIRCDECVFCGKKIESDSIINGNTIYEDINRNRYCVKFITNYFDDDDFYCDYGYNESDVYEILLKSIEGKEMDEDIDLVQEIKKLNIKNCEIDERKKEKIHYILILSGSNKYSINDNSYITSDKIPLATNFINLLLSTPGIRLEVFDNKDTFNSQAFTERVNTNKSRNIRCVSYKTTEELIREINSEKNVPFDIIIDMSSLYEYRIDDGKIISSKVNINFNKLFPSSYVIKIDDFGNKTQKELLEILKERLINYNEAYGYVKPKKHYYGGMNDEYDFYRVNGDELTTSDVVDVYKNIRRELIKK